MPSFPSLLHFRATERSQTRRVIVARNESLDHFRSKRNESHKVFLAQLAGDRAKDTCATWVIARCKNNGGVFVETDMRAIGAHILFRHTNYHRVHDITLLHLSIRSGLLDGGFNNIAYLCIALGGAAAHNTNTHNFFRASVVGDL